MRVFICAFQDFSLAIPMDSISSFSVYDNETEQKVKLNTENHKRYISLVELFNLPHEIIRHCIILKKQK